MDLFPCHPNLVSLLSLFLVCFIISLSAAETATTDGTFNDVQELNVKLTDLTAIVERLLRESKQKDNQLEELKSQWLQESELKDKKLEEFKNEWLRELRIKDHDIEVLKQRVSELESSDKLKPDNDKQQSVNTENGLKRSVNNENGNNMELTHRIHKRVPELPPVKIAFHASLSHNIPAQNNAVIVFDHVLLDTAHAYNNNSGLFTAPESGIYVLTWTTNIYHGWAFTGIMVNGISYGHTLADSEEVTDHHTATGVIVFHLSKGDNVNVQFKPDTNKGDMDAQWGMNSFSGWKLD